MKAGKLWLAALLGAAAAGPAGATTVEKLDLEAMVAQASTVIVGVVESSSAANTEHGVFTTTRVRVTDEVYGAAGGVIDVTTPGGVFKPGKFAVAEVNAGAPIFFNGQEVMLFLDGAANAGAFSVVGYSQGVVAVADTAQGDQVRLPEADAASVSMDEAKDRIRKIKAKVGDRARSRRPAVDE